MGAVGSALFTIAAVIAAGWLLGARRVLGPDAERVLARVVFVVATPCLLLVTIARTDLSVLVSAQAAVVWASTALVALIAVVVLRVAWHRSAGDVVIGTLASSYVNAGNLGIPLAVYLLGDAVAVVPTLLFQLLVLAPVAFTVLDAHPVGSPTALPARPGAVLRRTARNPIIVGTVVGLVLAALPWDLPGGALEPFRLIGVAAPPLALLVFGMTLAHARAGDGRFLGRDVVLAVVLRSVVHPLLALGLGRAVGLTGATLLAVVTMAALPTAQNVLVYALRYRRGVAVARDAGLVTTILVVPVMLVIAATLG